MKQFMKLIHWMWGEESFQGVHMPSFWNGQLYTVMNFEKIERARAEKPLVDIQGLE